MCDQIKIFGNIGHNVAHDRDSSTREQSSSTADSKVRLFHCVVYHRVLGKAVSSFNFCKRVASLKGKVLYIRDNQTVVLLPMFGFGFGFYFGFALSAIINTWHFFFRQKWRGLGMNMQSKLSY